MVSNSAALTPINLRRLLRIVAVAVICGLPAAIVSAQTGPVATPPGGVTTTDSDNGSGQSWGRAGGRTLTYTVKTPTQYSAISWGLANGTVPSLGGDTTTSNADKMTFDSNSALQNGQAVWNGIAPFTFGQVTISVPTRFTLTVTSNNAPVPLSAANGTLSPAIGLDAETYPTFSVKMLYTVDASAVVGGSSNFQPVLDFYDAQGMNRSVGAPTNSPGPVISELSVAFYYTGAVTTTNDPDAATTTQIQTDVTALTTNVTNVQTGVTGLQTSMAGLQTTVAGLQATLGTLQTGVTGIQTGMTGLQTQLAALQSTIQGSMAALQVTSSQVAPGPRSVWLLQSAYGGELVNGVVSAVTAIVVGPHGTTTQDLSAATTVLPVAPGILQVTINAHLKNVEAVQFSVQYQAAANVTANGSVITPYLRGEDDR